MESREGGVLIQAQVPASLIPAFAIPAARCHWSSRCAQVRSSHAFFALSPGSATELSWLLSRTHDRFVHDP